MEKNTSKHCGSEFTMNQNKAFLLRSVPVMLSGSAPEMMPRFRAFAHDMSAYTIFAVSYIHTALHPRRGREC